ncbi:MAG: hypothetical protein PUD20_09025, partial [bacterium]|nr:hypothetical protein [bacterium]
MIYQIRKLRPDEVGLLDNFLYEAIFIPEGVEAPPQDIIKQPELQVYVEDFGMREGDICFVAEVDRADIADEEACLSGRVTMVDEEACLVYGSDRPGNDTGSLVVGAVWVRIMNDYGHVDDETPSFAISLLK